MAINTRFNAKNGLSVGVPAIPIIDNEGNATFNNLSATGTVNGLTISSTSVSFPTRSAQNVTQSIATNVSDEILVGNNASGKRVIFGGGAQNNFMNAAGMTTAGLVVGTIANATAGVSIFGGLIEQRNDASPQESRIYGTYSSSGANYERFFVKTNTGGATQIGLSAAGTGQNRNLEFVTGGSTRMTVTSGGNIGIGTVTPTNTLHVEGTARISSGIMPTYGNYSWGFGHHGGGPAIYGGAFASGDSRFITIRGSGTAKLFIQNNSGVNFVTFDAPAQSLGIGTAFIPPASRLTVTGGDAEITDFASGIILKSPDGTRYRITVTNGGALSSTDLTPPPVTTTPPPVTTTLPP